jgi:hypothetical protein
VKLHNDVGVALVGFLLLYDELHTHQQPVGSLKGNQERYDPLRFHRARIIKFVWLEGFRFSNNNCCNFLSALWKFPIKLVELAFKMLLITISKSPPLLFW